MSAQKDIHKFHVAWLCGLEVYRNSQKIPSFLSPVAEISIRTNNLNVFWIPALTWAVALMVIIAQGGSPGQRGIAVSGRSCDPNSIQEIMVLIVLQFLLES